MSEPTPQAIEVAKDAMHQAEIAGPRAGASLDTLARAALSAAAPYLIRGAQAQALEDAARYIEQSIKAGADDSISPDETRNWLRARAAAIRDGNQ
jgi:hypothetical protein